MLVEDIPDLSDGTTDLGGLGGLNRLTTMEVTRCTAYVRPTLQAAAAA